jgi:hypothetical protein
MPTGVSEQEVLSVDQVFHLFLSKFGMPLYMNVVFLNKLDNFHKGRFLSVWVNFGERGKVLEDIQGH